MPAQFITGNEGSDWIFYQKSGYYFICIISYIYLLLYSIQILYQRQTLLKVQQILKEYLRIKMFHEDFDIL